MRKVCRYTREVLDIAAREIRPGVTTDHIDKVVHEACLERDVRISQLHPRNYIRTDAATSPTPPP